jgi:hypothetical protein
VQEEQTCGRGLAENSVLPARVGALTAAMADVLTVHRRALDLTDANAKAEDDVYADLVDKYGGVTAQLRTVADQMARSRDLPMGRHDERAATSVAFADAFETLVDAKQALSILLQQQLDQDQAMLVEIRRMSDTQG